MRLIDLAESVCLSVRIYANYSSVFEISICTRYYTCGAEEIDVFSCMLEHLYTQTYAHFYTFIAHSAVIKIQANMKRHKYGIELKKVREKIVIVN